LDNDVVLTEAYFADD
jgi:hypothetical protein